MFSIILSAAIFIQAKDVVLPHTGVEDVKLAKDYSGICLKIDGEYALYKKISPNVFVRQICNDSLMIFPDTTYTTFSFRFDLNGDGRIEILTLKKGILSIKQTGKKIELYSALKSFVFYDIDDNGSLDLIYVDSSNVLHILTNRYRMKNYTLVYSPAQFTVNYIFGKRKYPVTVYPEFLQAKVSLSGWDKIYIVYQGSTMPLERGKTVNLYNVENPIGSIVYKNDTLKLEISLPDRQHYTIEIKGTDYKNSIAEGVLPQGIYRFEYFVGPLSKGKYSVIITLGKRTFTREISVK